MVKITVDVVGMSCGMCESHVNEAIRNAFPVKKVSSSRQAQKTEILAEAPLDENKLLETINALGYQALNVKTEPWEKKRFSFFGR